MFGSICDPCNGCPECDSGKYSYRQTEAHSLRGESGWYERNPASRYPRWSWREYGTAVYFPEHMLRPESTLQ
jgi:Fe-S oxidoreductase